MEQLEISKNIYIQDDSNKEILPYMKLIQCFLDFLVIVDTDGASCVTASFVFGGDSTEREYDIRVLQYEADNEMGGPPGCLQFLLGTVAAPHSGTVTSFNWVTTVPS